MSNISEAYLNELLNEVQDYTKLKLNSLQLKQLSTLCDRWRDPESIETEINIYIQTIGYKYDYDQCKWTNKSVK